MHTYILQQDSIRFILTSAFQGRTMLMFYWMLCSTITDSDSWWCALSARRSSQAMGRHIRGILSHTVQSNGLWCIELFPATNVPTESNITTWIITCVTKQPCKWRRKSSNNWSINKGCVCIIKIKCRNQSISDFSNEAVSKFHFSVQIRFFASSYGSRGFKSFSNII